MTAEQTSVQEIDITLRSMAPPGVDTGSRLIDDADLNLLLPIERAAIVHAVPIRQREFATGRVLLRIGENELHADNRDPRRRVPHVSGDDRARIEQALVPAQSGPVVADAVAGEELEGHGRQRTGRGRNRRASQLTFAWRPMF